MVQEDYNEGSIRKHRKREKYCGELRLERYTVDVDSLEPPDDEEPVGHEVRQCEAGLQCEQHLYDEE